MSDARAWCFFRLTKWTDVLMGTVGSSGKPTADYMYVLELCVSDENKPLLLANSDFIPYLINGLFIDPAHPRADLKDEIKLWNQTMHAECLAQMALSPPGREALLQDAAVCDALRVVSEQGMGEEARDFAKAALMALSGDELKMRAEGDKHVMLSYQ